MLSLLYFLLYELLQRIRFLLRRLVPAAHALRSKKAQFNMSLPCLHTQGTEDGNIPPSCSSGPSERMQRRCCQRDLCYGEHRQHIYVVTERGTEGYLTKHMKEVI